MLLCRLCQTLCLRNATGDMCPAASSYCSDRPILSKAVQLYEYSTRGLFSSGRGILRWVLSSALKSPPSYNSTTSTSITLNVSCSIYRCSSASQGHFLGHFVFSFRCSQQSIVSASTPFASQHFSNSSISCLIRKGGSQEI